MSLKFLHQVIIFAAMSLSLFFAYWCFTSPDAAGTGYLIGGFVAIAMAGALVAYEVHFLKKTKRLIIH